MKRIQGITQDPLQNQVLTLSDGSSLSLTLKYIPMQYGWFIEELTYKLFTLHGFRVSTNPNMLHQYMHQLPFGLACFTTDGHEPKLQPDFATGYAKLWILDEDEVISYEEYLNGS